MKIKLIILFIALNVLITYGMIATTTSNSETVREDAINYVKEHCTIEKVEEYQTFYNVSLESLSGVNNE